MTRLEWLKARQQGIGASDAPIVVGLGFESADWLYRQKIEPPAEHEPETGPLARGTTLEPVVAEMYERKMGCRLVTPGPMIRHPRRSWQFCNLDRIRLDDDNTEPRDVELKAVAGFGDDWGDEGTDQLPDKYRVQCQHTMGVRGRDSMDLAALDVVAWELRVYRLAFDREFFEWLTAVEERFLRDHVLAKRRPGAEWADQFRPEAERRLVVPGKRVEFGEDVSALIRRRNELTEIGRECVEAAGEINEKLRELLGDAESATCPGFKLKWVARKAHTRPACDVAASTYLDVRAVKEKA